jgi:hypothetical protein
MFATLLFVALGLISSAPHPFDDAPSLWDHSRAIASSECHDHLPCPLCDWAAHATARPAVAQPPITAPALQRLRLTPVAPATLTASATRPVGRGPPSRFS